MSDRRGSRFVLEVLFLLALAVALTLTDLRPVEIAGVMLVGWVVVALFEWAAWRDEPHYGSGLPPRYYVPQVSLPPAQPLEQVAAGYPEARDEAPTWIASAALREEMLGDWPIAAPAEPPVSPPQPPSMPTPEPDPVGDPDPWTIQELPAAPLGELEPDDAAAPEPQEVADAEPQPVLEVVLTQSVHAIARYSLDPLAEPAPRRRFGRGTIVEAPAVEVPSRPQGPRPLPGRPNRQD
ncbi:MAG: hypothetical protein ACJ76I_12690 [Gaiellaceae bacterium]